VNDEGRVAGIYLERARSWTNAHFVHFADSKRARALIYRERVNGVTFRQCSFVDSEIGIIGHYFVGPAPDRREGCYVRETPVVGKEFMSGSAVIDSCRFAGLVPSATSNFTFTGVQVANAWTEIKIDTASLLPTCRGLAAGGLQPWGVALVSIGVVVVVAALAAFLVLWLRRGGGCQGGATASDDGVVGGEGDTMTTTEFTFGLSTENVSFSTFGSIGCEGDSHVPDDGFID
jgi:hypothetical protein